MASFFMILLGSGLPSLLPAGWNSRIAEYLQSLVFVAAFGFPLAGWGCFFLDSMCAFLGLAQAKFAPIAADFMFALVSLAPLGLIIASRRMASGFGP